MTIRMPCSFPRVHSLAAAAAALLISLPGSSSLVLADCQDLPCPAPPCCNGDTNGDASIDISDAVGLLGYLFSPGAPPPATIVCSSCPAPPCENGDVNGDGSINIADPVGLLSYLFSQGPEPDEIVCDPPGAVVVTFGPVVDWDVFANCMPIVPPDPWQVHFDLVYDNSQGTTAATVDILSAELILGAPGTALSITVSPATSGTIPAGATIAVTHTKTGALNDLPGDCGYCNTTATIEVTVEIGGQATTITSPPFTVMCAF